MPPIRTMPVVKPVRTERTHEENQERYSDAHQTTRYGDDADHHLTGPTSQLRDEAIAASRLASNLLGALPKSTRSALAALFVSGRRM